MSIRNIDLLIHDDHTVEDILSDTDNLSQVKIVDGEEEYLYDGDDIFNIDQALLDRRVSSCRFRMCDYGYFVLIKV